MKMGHFHLSDQLVCGEAAELKVSCGDRAKVFNARKNLLV